MRNYFRSFANGKAARQIVTMAGVGVVNTVVDFLLFNVFRWMDWNRYVALSVAFVLATFVSYVLNRRYTFGMAASGIRAEEGAGFFLVSLVALAITNGVMWLAVATFGDISQGEENLVKVVAAVIILVPKFAAFRDVVFRKSLAEHNETSRKP